MRIRVLLLAVGLSALGPTRSAQAQDTAAEGWRFTLHGAGELLPGGGKLRDGRGFGVGAGYSVLTLGAEYWRYQLTLHEAVNDEYEHAILWVFYPLVLGLNWEIPKTPLKVGASAAFGIGSGPGVTLGDCHDRGYTPAVERGQVWLHLVTSALSFGPYLGYASSSDSGTDSICLRDRQESETARKDYPQTIPLGFELGFGVDVWVR